MKDVVGAVQELETELMAIQARVETLSDIGTRLNWLKDDMAEIDLNDMSLVVYMFKEHHQTLRILQSLMNYTMSDLKEYCNTANELHSYLFDEIVRPARKEGK